VVWLAVLIAGLLTSDGVVLLARDGSGDAHGTARSSVIEPSPRPAPAPPARIAFARMDWTGKVRRISSVLPDGSGLGTPKTPAVRREQISSLTGLIVYSKTLDSSYVPPHTTCGIAGCVFGYSSYEEAAIAVALPDGSSERVLTPKKGFDTQPTFSPDGTVIAYLQHSKRKGDDDEFDMVVMMTPEGSRLGALVPPKRYTYDSPAWSPDGRSIAVLRRGSRNGAFVAEVVILPIDGSRPRVLANGEYRDLAWSRDGRFLAGVLARREKSSDAFRGDVLGDDLWLIPIDGGRLRNMTRLAPARGPSRSLGFCDSFGTPLPGRLGQPAWSSDGKQIAFLSSYRHVDRLSHIDDVAVVNANGSGMRLVYRSPLRRCYRPITDAPQPEQMRLLGWTTS